MSCLLMRCGSGRELGWDGVLFLFLFLASTGFAVSVVSFPLPFSARALSSLVGALFGYEVSLCSFSFLV